MGWNERRGRVSRSFDEWALAERDLRTFLKLGLAFSDEGYQARWDAIAHQPSDGEGPDLFDLMDMEVDGLIPSDFNWLLANLCVRDGVTLYETYLEKGLEEVYQHQVGTHAVAARSPNAQRVYEVYRDVLGVDPRPEAVDKVINLRDLLTHRRGELRTEGLREAYDTEEYGFSDLAVRLPPDEVLGSLDALRSSTMTVDAEVYRWSWGGEALSEESLRQMRATTKSWLQIEQ